MKKADLEDDDIPEYSLEELGPGERGKHYAAYQKGTNLVLLRPEVAAAFPTAEAVNQALMGLIELAKQVESSTKAREPRRARRAAS